MFRFLIVLLICLMPTVVWSAPQYSYPTKTAPVAGDKVLIVDSQDSWRTKNVLFSSFGSIGTVVKSGNYTIGSDLASILFGGVVFMTTASTATAPAVASGHNFCVKTVGNVAVSLDMNASDRMILDGITLADGDKATNTSRAGDMICCVYYSTDGLDCTSGTVLGGHWTDGN